MDLYEALNRLQSGNFHQPGPIRGTGRGNGQPWNGIVEDTPCLWVTWFVAMAHATGQPIPAAVAVGNVEVHIVGVELTFGARFYFRCPYCWRKCEAVYLVGGVPACRRCHRLGFRSQAQRSTSIYAAFDVLLDGRPYPVSPRYRIDESLLSDLLAGVRNQVAGRLAAALDGVEVATVYRSETSDTRNPHVNAEPPCQPAHRGYPMDARIPHGRMRGTPIQTRNPHANQRSATERDSDA